MKPQQQLPELRWAETLTKVMDDGFRVPGTGFRFGMDPVLGLVPFLGDAVAYLVSTLMVAGLARHGASGKLVFRMAGNILLDFLVGSIPLLGNIFDFTYKANRRNLRLMKAHYEEGKHKGSAWPYVFMLLGGLFFVLVLALYVTYRLLAGLWAGLIQ